MNKFIEEMMEIGVWNDRSGSETERRNSIKAAEGLYENHLAELNLLTMPNVVGQSEQLLAMFDLAQTMPNKLTKADKMKVINKFIANNCG